MADEKLSREVASVFRQCDHSWFDVVQVMTNTGAADNSMWGRRFFVDK